jgi:S-adenosyl methyltransferase
VTELRTLSQHGKDNFSADRAVAERVAAAYPDIRIAVRAQRAFLARAVHFLVTEAGIRQFLDIGTGLPSANNTHLVEPGLVQVHRWRAGAGDVGDGRNLAIYAGVGRKP